MWTRVASSAGVVVVGLLPALSGGPVFALLLVLLGVAGYREFIDLAARVHPGGAGPSARVGYGIVLALALVALAQAGPTALFAVVAFSVALPLVIALPMSADQGSFSGWTLASSGALYLGLPVYAAIALRDVPGEIDATWLSQAAARLSLGWDIAPRGLVWVLMVILAIWLGDSTAYIVGRSLGKHQLAPVLSPNKTVEGAVGGLGASVLVAVACVQGLGLGDWWLGVVYGVVIGVAGQIGDLAESFLKRQAGVKDSGTVIPGHGGILDRIDALLFAFPASLVLAAGVERLGP